MSLCWLAPAQRPSLRDLRIMLLHLRSSRDEPEFSEFDQRWERLMPRSPPAIVTTLPSVISNTADDEEAEMNFSLAPSARPKRSPADMQNAGLTMVHGLAGPGIPAIVRPGSFDSEFGSEFNASLLAHAGSLQTSLSTSPVNTPDDMTLDDSFTAMASPFSVTSNDHYLTANLTAANSSLSAFEMVSYPKTGEAETTELENEIKVDFDVNVSSNSPTIPPSSVDTGALPTEETDRLETVKDNFDSGEEDWQCFSDVSNQNVNNSSMSTTDEKQATDSKTDSNEVSANVSNDVGSSGSGEGEKNFLAVENEGGHNAENDVGSSDQPASKDGSFCMLKVSVSEDESPTKSLDIESPVKSTTSSADWCLVSNHTEHSREEELDTVSHVTDPSLPGDCVLVETKGKVTPEGASDEMTDADIGSAIAQENTSECSATDDKEQPVDDAAEQ